MLILSLISALTVTATVMVHALGTSWWLGVLRQHYKPRNIPILHVLVKTALILLALHVVEVFIWAAVYMLLPGSGLDSLEEAMYFSFTTFTTLGYGDITLSRRWHLLTGIESLNGILLVGWSTALSFAVIQRMWGLQDAAEIARAEGEESEPSASTPGAVQES